jgi:hypothetical protein
VDGPSSIQQGQDPLGLEVAEAGAEAWPLVCVGMETVAGGVVDAVESRQWSYRCPSVR